MSRFVWIKTWGSLLIGTQTSVEVALRLGYNALKANQLSYRAFHNLFLSSKSLDDLKPLLELSLHISTDWRVVITWLSILYNLMQNKVGFYYLLFRLVGYLNLLFHEIQEKVLELHQDLIYCKCYCPECFFHQEILFLFEEISN